MVFSPDNRLFAGYSWADLTVWNASTGKIAARMKSKSLSISALSFGPDPRTIIAANWPEPTIDVWDITNQNVRGVLKGHRKWVAAMTASRDGRSLVTTDGTETVRLWDLQRNVQTASYELGGEQDGKERFFSALAFSSDSRMVAIGGSVAGKGEIKFLSIPDFKVQAVLNGFEGRVGCIVFCGNDANVIASTYNDIVEVYDWKSGRLISKWSSGIACVNAIALSHDNGILATAGAQPRPGDDPVFLGEVRLWKMKNGIPETGKHIASVDSPNSIDYLAITIKGDKLVTSGRGSASQLWKIVAEQP